MALLLDLPAFMGLPAAAGLRARAQSQAPPSPPSAPATQPPAPQQTIPPADIRSRMVVESRLVLVPVTVKDKDGHLVGGLQKEDFRVFADGIEQKILLFTSDPFPLSAVVVIDNDLSDKAAGQVQKSLVSISAGFGPDDEVAVMTYSEFPHTVSDFSTDNDLLFTQLKRLELGSHTTAIVADPTTAGPMINGRSQPNGLGIPLHGSGRPQVDTALSDAVYAAGDLLKGRGRGRRKIVFLLSDGSDSGRDQHTFDETLHSLLAADVSVYSISVSHQLPIGKGLLERGALEADKYALETGGDTFYAAKPYDLERLYSDVTEQARNEYTLTFSPNAADRSHDFHPIEVRVRRPDLDVRARNGYYQSAFSAGH
ncbi:MAG: VWA domain-containing protein [Candidatus Acidiferrales bacterium]